MITVICASISVTITDLAMFSLGNAFSLFVYLKNIDHLFCNYGFHFCKYYVIIHISIKTCIKIISVIYASISVTITDLAVLSLFLSIAKIAFILYIRRGSIVNRYDFCNLFHYHS